MATQSPTAIEPEQDQTVEQKIQQLRALFADAPEVGKTALENVLALLTSHMSAPPPPVESLGESSPRAPPSATSRAYQPTDSAASVVRLIERVYFYRTSYRIRPTGSAISG